MGTKNNPGQYDCYANADPDEPLFVLLARDKFAPALLWLWATLRELDGEDPKKVAQAREVMIDMMRWAKEHDRKIVGLGQAAMAAVMELVRTCNAVARDEKLNEATDDNAMRVFLAYTQFEGGPDDKKKT